MQCPICTRPAENLTPNTLDGVVVGCDHCGDYRVSGTAFYGLTRLAAHQRAAARVGMAEREGARIQDLRDRMAPLATAARRRRAPP